MTYISIGLKLDGLLSWPWLGILWPVWVGMGTLCVIGVAVLMLGLGAICTFYNDPNTIDEIYLPFWLFYCIVGAICSFSSILISLVQNSNKFSYILGIVYLIGFILSTTAFHRQLLSGWGTFFTINISLTMRSSPNQSPVNPEALAQYQRYKRIMSSLKLPPSSLIKISNSYFKPNIPPQVEKNNTFSEIVEILETDDNRLHARSRTAEFTEKKPLSSIQPVNESPELDIKCNICSENECNGVLMECGHGGICHSCAEILMDTKGTCHICRGEISCVLKIKVEPKSVVNVVGVVYL